jgi:hypothetical protein
VIGERVFPSWDRRGGRAIKRMLRSLHLIGADGVVSSEECSTTDHPVCAASEGGLFLMAQPPLLSKEGNTPLYTLQEKCE